MTEYRELKQAIIDTCLQLEAIGFVIGTYGNASARVPGGLIVTPSRVDYHSITPDDMVTVADDGHVLDGHRLPSSETDVHRLIYLARSDVGAVLQIDRLGCDRAGQGGVALDPDRGVRRIDGHHEVLGEVDAVEGDEGGDRRAADEVELERRRVCIQVQDLAAVANGHGSSACAPTALRCVDEEAHARAQRPDRDLQLSRLPVVVQARLRTGSRRPVLYLRRSGTSRRAAPSPRR